MQPAWNRRLGRGALCSLLNNITLRACFIWGGDRFHEARVPICLLYESGWANGCRPFRSLGNGHGLAGQRFSRCPYGVSTNWAFDIAGALCTVCCYMYCKLQY